MKKQALKYLSFLFLIALYWNTIIVLAQCNNVAGTVFNDYNANGLQDTGELGVVGITVIAYGDNNLPADSTITIADGSYTINGLNGSYRVEFTNLPDWLTVGPYANNTSETSVQFVSGTNCTANLGVHNPMDYCTENPLMSTPCYIEGDPLAGGSSGTRDWLVTFEYDNNGEIDAGGYPEPTHKINGTVIGSTWGVAYHRRSQTLFTAAMIKRHAGLGTGGTGEIYRIDLSSGTPNIQTFINLNTYAGVNTGDDPRDGSTNNTLPSSPSSNSRDINAFDDVGKKAIGDIDLSEDERTLYAINLNDRTLHQIPIGDNPTAPANINTYDPIAAMEILHPGGCGRPNDYRPWALKVYQGLVYVGIVCSADSSQDATELHAYILAFNPANTTFSAVFDFNLNYGRDNIIDYQGSQISGNWRPWVSSWNQVSVFGGDNNAGAPQPILSDIEFDRDGSMILGFIDRFGHQSGFFSYSSDPNDDDLYIGISGGETLRACKTATGFELEGTGACAYNDANEFYDQDFFFDTNVFGNALGHYETSVGGLALSKLKDEVAVTIFDPYWIQSGGVAWWDNTNGTTDHVYELYNFDETSNGGPFGKASGLGDLELLCPPAPLEIGNRIWADTDSDGIQDPNELGIDGITVHLYLQNGTLVGQTTTTNGGQYLFTNATVILNGSIGILYNTNYVIALDDATNYNGNQELDLSGTNYGTLTTVGTGTSNADLSDSDGLIDNNSGIVALNNFPYIGLTTGNMGENDHTYDFGFRVTTNANCELTITHTFSSNCSGIHPFIADWHLAIAVTGEPDNSIVYQRNSDPSQTHLLTGLTDTLTISSIPADGGLYDTLKVWFANETTCGDTVLLKRPVPCPADLGSNAGEICTNAATEIAGTVFEDWNYDGLMNQSDVVGVAGILVTATDCKDNTDTTYTDTNGNYQFNGLTNGDDYRIEFSLPEVVSCWACPTHAGSDNGTIIQFVQAGDCAHLGIASPADYCQNNPFVATSCYVEAGSTTDVDALVSVPFHLPNNVTTPSEGGGSLNQHEALVDQIGATYGLAYQRSSNTLFAAAFLKRHTSYGTADNPSAIYRINDPSDGATTGVSVFVDLSTLLGNDIAGSNTHPSGSDFYLDAASYDQVGKRAFGDMDISSDESILWTINLYTRELYKIPLGNDPSNPMAPTDGNQISRYPLYNICDCNGDGMMDGSNEVDIRPFALQERKGELYIGLVCSGESTPNDYTKLTARAFKFSPLTETFEEVLQFDLTYNRGCAYSDECNFQGTANVPAPYTSPNTANWRPWDDTYDTDELSYRVLASWNNGPDNNNMYESGYAQPIFSDIDFDGAGNMYIGLRDRFADMSGDGTPAPDNSILLTIDGVGDVLKAIPTPNGQWNLSLTDATNGSEFFAGDNFGTQHLETSNGGLAYKMGTDTLIYTAMDPVQNVSGGFDWVNIKSGSLLESYQVYRRERYFEHNTTTFGKANGLGDIEVLCVPAPIEIGNYIWVDANNNGIQDACEIGLDGVTVQLFDDSCASIASTTTTNGGQYYFNETNTTGLIPNTNYYVVVGNGQFASGTLSINGTDYILTTANIGFNNSIDSDGAIGIACGSLANLPYHAINTKEAGCNNHSYDFGFIGDCESYLNNGFVSGDTVTTCACTFYDPGKQTTGVGYTDAQDFTVTYCSQDGRKMMLKFMEDYNLVNGDTLIVYDGASINAPIIGKYGAQGTAFPLGAPNVIISTDTCLTIQFIAENTSDNAGWRAELSCLENCTDGIDNDDTGVTDTPDWSCLPEWSFACNEDRRVDLLGKGTLNNWAGTDTIHIDSSSYVYQIAVEALYRTHTGNCLPDSVTFTTSNGTTHTLYTGLLIEIPLNGDITEFDATAYRAIFSETNISWVAVSSPTTNNCEPISFLSYVFRQGTGDHHGAAGKFINDFVGIEHPKGVHCIDLTPLSETTDLKVTIPIADPGGATANITVTAGGVTQNGLFNSGSPYYVGSDLILGEMTLANVPAGTEEVCITMISQSAASYSISGAITIETLCAADCVAPINCIPIQIEKKATP